MLLLGMLSACNAVSSPKETLSPLHDSKPNIIYILADDLGYADIGPFGQQQVRTPNLDRMAREGIRFTQHYSGSTVCAPSRCTLMTGLHTGHAPLRSNQVNSLEVKDTTVAELLQSAGYATGLIGKWGLGELGSEGVPNKKGFDYFYGFLNQIRAHNFYPDYVWENEQKVFFRNEIVMAESTYAKGIGNAASKQEVYIQDQFNQKALDFIERSRERPFFLYYAMTLPHANNEYWLVEEHGMEVPDYGIYANKDWPEAQKGLASMITYMDKDIGQILDKLKELGIDDRTLVIFTSDNGPHAEGKNDPHFFDSNGPFRGIKRDLYEGGIRSPFVARWPGSIPPGSTSGHISAFWDFLPTACELAGLELPKNTDGISYLPSLLHLPNQQQHDLLYWEFHKGEGKQAIRQGPWKALRVGLNETVYPAVELYNLEQDPAEENDLSAEKPELVQQLFNKMMEQHTPWKYHYFLFEKNN